MKKTTSYLANNKTNQELHDHCLAVSWLACEIAKKLNTRDSGIRLSEAARVAGFLHDIGKVDGEYQDWLKGKKKDSKDKKIIFHNEISAYIAQTLMENNYTLSEYYSRGKDKTNSTKFEKLVTYTIFYHHPRRKETNDNNSISSYNDIVPSEATFKKAIQFLNDFSEELGFEIDIDKLVDDPTSQMIPFYYLKENSRGNVSPHEKFFVLNCVAAADRIISRMSNDELQMFIENKNYEIVLNGYVKKFNPISVEFPSCYDKLRLAKQKEIADKAMAHRTTVINAPTAFGKTMIMFFMAISSDKPTFIVCPRNVIAENIYDELVEISSNFGLNGNKINIELYFASKVQSSNCGLGEDEGFGSRIVVTNIDNYVKSFNDYRLFKRNFNILDSNLIIDEFQELISDAPLYSITEDILKMRHLATNTAKTILLSATPGVFPARLGTPKEDDNENVHYLPAKNRHYKASHQKPYLLKVDNEYPKGMPKNAVVILNSIRNVQRYHGTCKIDLIVHSKYTDSHKKENLDKLIKIFGKHELTVDELMKINEKVTSKEELKKLYTTVGSLIIQASLNISYNGMAESVLSPETTIQRLGRNNRFGTYDKSMFKVFNVKDVGESSVGRILYDNKLREKWFAAWSLFVASHPEATLDEIYQMYNDYNKNNSDELLLYLGKLYEEGMDDYNTYKMWPTRIPGSDDDENVTVLDEVGIKSRGGLRDPLGGVFVAPSRTPKKNKNNEYLTHTTGEMDGMINIPILEYKQHFAKSRLSNMKDADIAKEIEKLIYYGYSAFGSADQKGTVMFKYESHKKSKKSNGKFFTEKFLKDMGRWSETPIPGMDYYYDLEKGLTDKLKD